MTRAGRVWFEGYVVAEVQQEFSRGVNKMCFRYGNLALVAVVSLVVAGCGSGKATVQGKVTRKDGSPVVGARINLRSTEPTTPPRSARAVTDNEGHYTLGTINKGDGIYPGSYYAIVVENRGGLDSAKPRTIAEKYEFPDRSGLSLEVARGEQKVFNLVLDPK